MLQKDKIESPTAEVMRVDKQKKEKPHTSKYADMRFRSIFTGWTRACEFQLRILRA